MALVVREYIDANGRVPFRDWLAELDKATRARVQARVLRFETGNLGDHKSVGSGVWEARMDFGAGYRVYFGKSGGQLILLLVGGDKSSQVGDIKQARKFWREYLQEEEHGKAK